MYWALKVTLTPLLVLAFRVRVEGIGRVPRRGAVILASNHVSFIDSMFIPLVVLRRVTFVAKAEYFDDRKTGWFFRNLGMIPMRRGGGSASERALAAARDVLGSGGVIGIYPEGTRSPDGRLYKGHTGVARLALQCNAAVVPMCTFGTAEVQPIGVKIPQVGKSVKVKIGEPLRWPGLADRSDDPVVLRRVTDEIMSAIGALSGSVPLDVYATRNGS
ncbi:MAG: lysophospholipid acyltransferase family protein [Acidimicrobiales bacterium]